jgi:predicted transposase YdaD
LQQIKRSTFINSGRKEVYEKLVEEDKTFEEAYERLKKASSDEKLMAMYRSREKAIRDWNDSINSARREGELQGKRIGLQEGIQTGQIRTLVDLVDDGLLDIKKAAERAGLTLEEFQKRMQEENRN